MALFQPSRQPKKIYSKGNLGAFLARTGSGLGKAGGSLFKELTKPGPRQQQKSSGNFSSPYFKNPYMQIKKGMSIISGIRGSKDEKRVDKIRAKAQIFDPNRKDDPLLSREEANQAIGEAREELGDEVAEEAEAAVKTTFRGRHTINANELDLPFASIGRKRGRHIGEILTLIKDQYDPNKQNLLGRGAKYLTKEKLEKVIAVTEKESGKYAAQALRKGFMVTEEGGKTPKETSSRIVGLQEGLLGWGRKTNNDTSSDNK